MFIKQTRSNKVKRMTTLAILLALIVPVIVTASVIVGYTYPFGTGSAPADIYLTEGPNYPTANEMGLLSLSSPATSNGITSGTTITVNTVTGSGDVYLLNVLEVYNTTGWDKNKAVVNMFINGSLPSGVTMYYSTSPITYTSSSLSGTLLNLPSGGSTNGPINIPAITSSGAEIYFAFAISGTTSGTGTVTVQFSVS